MDLRDLIASTNSRGHFGVRGTVPDDPLVVEQAVDLGLVRLISAWRSDEDDVPEYRSCPIDRRVYGLTRAGWHYKITGGTALLKDYKTVVAIHAIDADWGTLDDECIGLRYSEETFDNWEGFSNTHTEISKWHGPIYMAKGTAVLKQMTNAPGYPWTPPPGSIIVMDEIVPDAAIVSTPYPRQELVVPGCQIDENIRLIRFPGMTNLEWAVACAVLVALALAGWWLS